MTLDKTVQVTRDSVAKKMRGADAASAKKACFIILGGLDVGSVISVGDEPMVIGRDSGCDLILRDDGISREHAKALLIAPDRILVKDLGSTNGIFVNGERVPEVTLRDGGKVLLGRRTVLKFALQDELEQSYHRQLYESSTRDGLTGVFNRKHFSFKLVSDLSFARRHKIPITLLMLDIDFFKKINDAYGHPTGDHVLVTVTGAIDRMIRAEDVLARYGGEEFAIIAQGTHAEGGMALAERIRKGIEELRMSSLNDSGTRLGVTMSIGVATVQPGVETTPEDVISAADKNLYQAKESGRNRTIATVLERRGDTR